MNPRSLIGYLQRGTPDLHYVHEDGHSVWVSVAFQVVSDGMREAALPQEIRRFPVIVDEFEITSRIVCRGRNSNRQRSMAEKTCRWPMDQRRDTVGPESPVACLSQRLPRVGRLSYLGHRCISLLPLFSVDFSPGHFSARNFENI
jgi:hypothetical protein